MIGRGTALEPVLALKGVECTRLRQIRAFEAGEKAVTSLQGNTHKVRSHQTRINRAIRVKLDA